MSSLLHPLHSASQKCRPKHQVLVLKCYPQYQKTVQEVKPNSSELSYLLYYASTRRSKLQKVGAFLEKKNAHDVWKGRLGNVQVTLQILTAIIEKAPRDLSLYSASVLTILGTVLRSKDINMVEETVPTFEAYCKHVDSASLTADQQRAQQYLSIVQLYAGYAEKQKPAGRRNADSIPLSLRWRTVGLRAIRAVVASDALATDSSQQLNLVMPVILENMSLEAEDILSHLQERARTSEKFEDEIARRRRISLSTVTTVDTTDGDPATAVETTAGADKVAEEEVRALALRCLKQIFSIGIGSTRGQTRLATALTLKFIASKNPPRPNPEIVGQGTWATSLFEAIARWTPVQDRFIILITAMETLVRTPVAENLLEKQLVLATMIDWLLSSSVNLIGLSVMDVLLGFIQHMLLLLQLGGPNPRIRASHPNDTMGFSRETREAFDPSTVLTATELDRTPSKVELAASPTRKELLVRLQKCIASLSNHIYYTDQISDMITAILARLKPSPQSEVPTIAAAIDDPAAATKAIAESASVHEDPNTSSFFSFTTARVAALQVIQAILIRANSKRSVTGGPIEARARVGVQVWEGTQWLLKDEEKEVRFAYVEGLLTWLKLETNKSDTLLPKNGSRKHTPNKKQGVSENLAKRAVSGASRKEPKPNRSTFVTFLHLAIYDSILDDAEDEANLLLLHLLLTKLVDRLGVNSVRSGLPMMLRLQETALNGEVISATGRVNVASVVQSYLWTLASKFDFEMSPVGYEINGEISRRKRLSIWCEKVKYPAAGIDEIRNNSSLDEKQPQYSEESVDTLKPFLSVTELVNEIATSYDKSLLTPPSSAPSSPGRVFSVPTLGFGYGYGAAPVSKPSKEEQLPEKVKEEMAAGWSREACIAAVEKESATSMTGSRTGGSSLPRYHLGVNGARNHGSVSGQESPVNANGSTTPTYGLASGLGTLTKARRPSANGSPTRVPTTSSRDSTMRVTDLKRALSGYAAGGRRQSPLRKPLTGSRRSTRSSMTSSMVSWDEADDRNPSFLDVRTGGGLSNSVNQVSGGPRPPTSTSTKTEGDRDGSVHNAVTLPATDPGLRNDIDIPPVPKIPSSLNLPGTWPRDISPARTDEPHLGKTSSLSQEHDATPQSKRATSGTYSTSSAAGKQSILKSSRPTSRKGASPTIGSVNGRFDLNSLLAEIPSATEEREEGPTDNRTSRQIRPPY
ncbi:uncharacterized protein PV06_03852 [Exophiala oligosperma]|uniref:Protein EFR3 n=1 Tax=Exophiala oligosperma TaxID=215243 RepID=A0A0D2B064_9EURO|nr:uncharacterized protein PV06_03852 [Exophiala oligosperma]KIW45461.1 hypothetical protein PV06_03852 [Exophiala oligosperma]